MEEKLTNRTCGECKKFCTEFCACFSDIHDLKNHACMHFVQKKNPTIGDKIRQMSDEELAEKLVYQRDDGWWVAVIVYDGAKFTHKETALAATVEGLKKEWKG